MNSGHLTYIVVLVMFLIECCLIGSQMYSFLVPLNGIAMNYRCKVRRCVIKVVLTMLQIKLKMRQINGGWLLFCWKHNLHPYIIWNLLTPFSMIQKAALFPNWSKFWSKNNTNKNFIPLVHIFGCHLIEVT